MSEERESGSNYLLRNIEEGNCRIGGDITRDSQLALRELQLAAACSVP